MNALSDVLAAHPVVHEAWLAGWLNRTTAGDEWTDSAVALVVDDPVGVSDAEHTAVIEALDPVASGLGLEIKRWAWVPGLIVERMIESCGVRIYPRG